ncbi:MAG: hypothetical protein GF397_05830 [Elusimicrobia bacterium]|nr:hypothetical protein [Elusimicrobiota bacterium]
MKKTKIVAVLAQNVSPAQAEVLTTTINGHVYVYDAEFISADAGWEILKKQQSVADILNTPHAQVLPHVIRITPMIDQKEHFPLLIAELETMPEISQLNYNHDRMSMLMDHTRAFNRMSLYMIWTMGSVVIGLVILLVVFFLMPGFKKYLRYIIVQCIVGIIGCTAGWLFFEIIYAGSLSIVFEVSYSFLGIVILGMGSGLGLALFSVVAYDRLRAI